MSDFSHLDRYLPSNQEGEIHLILNEEGGFGGQTYSLVLTRAGGSIELIDEGEVR